MDQEPRPAPPTKAAAPLQGRHERSPDHAQDRRIDAELTPAERDEKEEVRAQAAAALVSVYDQLHNRPDPGSAEISQAIRTTPPLTELSPLYMRQVETVISTEHLAQKSQAEFVSRGLEVLDLWIHIQGLKRGTNRDLESLRADIGKR